jgi:hypothetical protein
MPKRIITRFRKLGPRWFAKALRDRAWSERLSFGLVCDLSKIPPARSPKIAVVMHPCTPQQFTGFADEFGRVSGNDSVEVDQRVLLCDAGVPGLHVATTPEGRPIYAQWLVDSGNQSAFHRATHGQFPDLAQDEALVEGAYTFVDFRRLGAMGEGTRQLLVKAAEGGGARCYTYVGIENVPSLRGVANAGFDLDHICVTAVRAGRRHVLRRPPLPRERAQWEAAVKPKQRASAT